VCSASRGSALYAPIEARDEVAGAPAIDPQLLLGLWVYATSEGEGSAREIWRLTQMHAAYRWLCGGVDVGYHTVSDFRSQQGAGLDALITQVLALLMKQDLVDLTRVAQDGTRVRASAGGGIVPTRADVAGADARGSRAPGGGDA
jgi:transposase